MGQSDVMKKSASAAPRGCRGSSSRPSMSRMLVDAAQTEIASAMAGAIPLITVYINDTLFARDLVQAQHGGGRRLALARAVAIRAQGLPAQQVAAAARHDVHLH